MLGSCSLQTAVIRPGIWAHVRALMLGRRAGADPSICIGDGVAPVVVLSV